MNLIYIDRLHIKEKLPFYFTNLIITFNYYKFARQPVILYHQHRKILIMKTIL